jgi:hypothetical protein
VSLPEALVDLVVGGSVVVVVDTVVVVVVGGSVRTCPAAILLGSGKWFKARMVLSGTFSRLAIRPSESPAWTT